LLEKILHNDEILSIIIRHQYSMDGVDFFTPDHFGQQLGHMKHPKGKKIRPHIHNRVERTVELTQEVLVIKKGRLRVDFYDDEKNYLESRELGPGDIILLAGGGHGFEALDELEMIEIKQGPYVGEQDKIRFDSIEPEKIEIKRGH
jgi:mannose-6-phosphate isomerase-like protein (cupin superfamily)